MKKERSPFEEGRLRTGKSDARRREVKVIRSMEELTEIADEDEFKRRLPERFSIVPGHPRYEKAVSTWRELRREKP